jgi:hypothetical protein
VADAVCNADKRSFLAGSAHLARWVERGGEQDRSLQQIVELTGWPRAPARTGGTVRAAYLRLRAGQPLWICGREFELLEPQAIRRLLT